MVDSFDEIRVACEVASEIISQYTAIAATRLAEEKARPTPNVEQIALLEEKLRDLHREKLQLSTENTSLIERAFNVYAEMIRRVS